MNIIASALIMWAAAHPGIAQDAPLINALYFLQFGFGGVGFSVPMGLLIAGISIPSLLMKLLPKWLGIFNRSRCFWSIQFGLILFFHKPFS